MLDATEYLAALQDALARVEATDGAAAPVPVAGAVPRAVEMILRTAPSGRKVLLVGNGGSASIVGHMHNDLCKAVGVRALAFQDTALLTALSNDEGYIHAYERPVELWADAKDLLVAVSSSGRSENILRAARAAQLRGARLLTFTGFRPDNPLRGLGELNFYVPASIYGHVELAHQALAHCITDLAVHVQSKGNPPPGFP